MNNLSIFIFNIFINSYLAFFTVAILIEGIIFLFRINQGRFTSILRIIPIIKLPFDLFWYNFSKWSYFHGINPLTCEEGTRTLSVKIGSMTSNYFFLPTSCIQFTIPGDMTFTIADVISYFIHPFILHSFCLFLLLCSLYFIINTFMMYRHLRSKLNNLVGVQRNKNKKIRNSFIKAFFTKYQPQVVISSSLTGSPFVIGLLSSKIYIPINLYQNLSRREYEAVLAHEIEHIRYKDNLVRLLLSLIRSIFWWIPTKWFQTRIEEGFEISCDLNCKNYGINPIDLASAICKSAKNSVHTPHQVFANHLVKYFLHNRVNLLLQDAPQRFKKIRFLASCIAISIAFFVIFLGKFWIF